MRKVVLVDRGDHFHVLGDYTGSARIAALTPEAWKAEYESHPSFESTRASQPGSFAEVTPVGVGKWKKDWSGPFPG
jgi:hypothetical protein